VQTADNNDQNGASRRKRSQAENGHCNTTAVFYGVTRTRAQGTTKSEAARLTKVRIGGRPAQVKIREVITVRKSGESSDKLKSTGSSLRYTKRTTAKATGISVILRKQNGTETAQAAENNGPKRRKPLTTTKPKRVKPLKTTTETARAADNKRPKRRKPLTTKGSRKQALQHDRGILRSNTDTGARKQEISSRKANESRESAHRAETGTHISGAATLPAIPAR